MMGFRDSILTLTAEEEHPLGEALVRKRFFHAMSVGFKLDTIRLELGPFLKSGDLQDDELKRNDQK